MSTSEQAQWELLLEIKRFHHVERLTQRMELRRRYDELLDDERESSLESRQRIRTGIADVGEMLRLIEGEVTQLEKDLGQLTAYLKEARAR